MNTDKTACAKKISPSGSTKKFIITGSNEKIIVRDYLITRDYLLHFLNLEIIISTVENITSS